MIVNFDDYLFEELLNESMINEEINYDKIKNIIGKIRDKKQAVENLIKKFNESNNMHFRKHIATILILLFFGNMMMRNSIWSNAVAGRDIKPDIDKVAMNISKQRNLDVKKIKSIAIPILIPEDQPEKRTLIKPNINNVIAANSVDITKVRTSKEGKKFIKEYETLKLTAYADHGMVSIGWGHAEYPKQTKYKVGVSKITEQQAEVLFEKDVKRIEDGVKRLLSDWKKDGIDIKITQSMFDSMVSMAFNMGVSGFMNSNWLHDLKTKNYKTAAEGIKKCKVRATVKDKKGNNVTIELPGLVDRREAEAQLFLKGTSVSI